MTIAERIQPHEKTTIEQRQPNINDQNSIDFSAEFSLAVKIVNNEFNRPSIVRFVDNHPEIYESLSLEDRKAVDNARLDAAKADAVRFAVFFAYRLMRTHSIDDAQRKLEQAIMAVDAEKCLEAVNILRNPGDAIVPFSAYQKIQQGLRFEVFEKVEQGDRSMLSNLERAKLIYSAWRDYCELSSSANISA